MGANIMRTAAAFAACMISIGSGGSLAVRNHGLSVPGELSWILMPLAQTLTQLFGPAAWYIPVFYLFLAVLLVRGTKSRRQFMHLLLTVIPFLTGLLYLAVQDPSGEFAPAQGAAQLFGRSAAASIVGIILLLQLTLLFFSFIRSKSTGDIVSQQPAGASSGHQIEIDSVKIPPDGTLRFPDIPAVPELPSFRKIFSAMEDEEQPEQPIDGEDEFLQGENEPVRPIFGVHPRPYRAPAYPDDKDEQDQAPQEPSEEELQDEQLERDYSGGVLTREEVDLKNTVTPTLPPEDPKFQNLVEPEEENRDPAEQDWARREAETAPLTRKKSSGRPRGDYRPPPEDILATYPDLTDEDDAYTRAASEALMRTFSEFGIEAELTGVKKGPVVTMFEILPAPGVRVSAITNLSDNIALQLAASRVRIVAPIPGKQAVGIEVPNRKRTIVSFKAMIEEADRQGQLKIPMALGKDIMGELKLIDLVRTPHLLIAGATGSGKSVCVNALICSILYRRSPKDVRLMLIDPKIVELKLYNDIPHLLTPVISDAKKTLKALQYCIYEMERRYNLLDALGVRDISSYNMKIQTRDTTAEHLPYIVLVIDEFADLMSTIGKELEQYLARLAAMARAVGIHLVLATQRPSTNVITGLIKANIPSRIAFMVVSNTDSRIIIDMPGAEKLLGKGDMLFLSSWEAYPTRIQGAFLSEEEVERIVGHVKENGEPDYLDESYFLDDEDPDADDFDGEGHENDPLMTQAMQIVQERSVASASMLQRRLKIGYNRAARMIETMEEMGVVGPAAGSKPREVLRFHDFGDS